ncbi:MULTISPECIES: DUF3343 domain-containing protein [Gordonibacter]|uniref:DUF3343 domain-containing protein n=1 Tax=Gordonibacter faecis TaxID=3047475 RepID=A0ABT7DIT1_9ACTN|nr:MULTISPECIES: DUF3343 domain-containing protein [unclassified Gordonibacter]MDJ1649431.1 DUF3343 domain-containing protein [Gordonibacter sp. KGMB12511]HIW75105.1 DUF3343 domain-containing protein [Candidatus Gordonibacter avicola]
MEPSASFYVIAFESTHAAMAANKALAAAGCAFAMIPTPREISAGCGMSLRFAAPSDAEAQVTAQGVSEAHSLAALYAKEYSGYRLIEKL